jgi:phosphoribosyl 1,2-cyclic phosphodiesterase
MRVELWGTRGSVASAGPDTAAYGGDTASVAVHGPEGEVIILDAGSGIRALGSSLACPPRVDILLTHLHMDHIQGLGFFTPIFNAEIETHIWGPVSTTQDLAGRLRRYLSPPLFPVRLRDLPRVTLHDVGPGTFSIGSVEVTADLVIHPGPTLGFRLSAAGRSLAYIPDHEPALSAASFPPAPNWTSGFDLMAGVDLLIHDAQYFDDEYAERVGWGHSTFDDAMALAEMAGVGTLVTFHHDPSHTDEALDRAYEELSSRDVPFAIVPGKSGSTFEL